MKDRFRARFWQMVSMTLILLVAYGALTGCGTHTWMGIGRDMQESGRWIYNTNLEKQNEKEHGQHFEHWSAGIRKFVSN